MQGFQPSSQPFTKEAVVSPTRLLPDARRPPFLPPFLPAAAFLDFVFAGFFDFLFAMIFEGTSKILVYKLLLRR